MKDIFFNISREKMIDSEEINDNDEVIDAFYQDENICL